MAVEQLVKETGNVGDFPIFLAATGMSAIQAVKGKILQELQTFVKEGKVHTL